MVNIALSKEIMKSEQNRFWKRNIFNVIATSSSVSYRLSWLHYLPVFLDFEDEIKESVTLKAMSWDRE